MVQNPKTSFIISNCSSSRQYVCTYTIKISYCRHEIQLAKLVVRFIAFATGCARLLLKPIWFHMLSKNALQSFNAHTDYMAGCYYKIAFIIQYRTRDIYTVFQ